MKKGKRKTTPAWYLILVIIYGTLGLIISFLLLGIGEKAFLLSLILTPIEISWFIFSIVMLVIFVREYYEKVALVLPIYYMGFPFFALILGFGMGLVTGATAEGFGKIIYSSAIIGIFTSLFEIGFASFLLSRK